jgi:hypothetical protein
MIRTEITAAVLALALFGQGKGFADESCESSAVRKYNAAKVQAFEAARQASALKTVQEIVSERRLQEAYCQKVAACRGRSSADEAVAATIRTLAFTTCIEDEEKEEVLDRLKDGDAKELKDAISRLQSDD